MFIKSLEHSHIEPIPPTPKPQTKAMKAPQKPSFFTLTFLIFILFSFHLPFSASAACNADDKAALEKLKSYFGVTDLFFYNWNWFFDCCNWNGVGCDSAGRVISLSLDLKPVVHIFRTFEIPSSIEELEMLKSLKLSVFFGAFVGPIPRAIAHLYDLEHLDLSDNRLTGPVPGFLGQLESLKYIDLSSNRLTGPVPQTLGFLTFLSTLKLGSNQLVGLIPNNTGQIRSLETLDLSCNNLNGTIPIQLGRLTRLSSLDLHNNRLTGLIPPELAQAPLKKLDLSDNQLCGPIPQILSKFKAQSFKNNKCLCGKPLAACRNWNLVQGIEQAEELLSLIE